MLVHACRAYRFSEKIPSQVEIAVMQCLQELAGSQFGYTMHNWGPGTNGEAIERFEKWLKERATQL